MIKKKTGWESLPGRPFSLQILQTPYCLASSASSVISGDARSHTAESGKSESNRENPNQNARIAIAPLPVFEPFDRLAQRFFVQVKILFSLIGLSLKGVVWRDESRQDKI